MQSPARERGFKYFHYDPSPEATLLFTAIFGISTLLHFYQMVRTRTWFVTPFVIGGVLSIIGYAARYISTTQTPDWTLGPYIGSTLGLLLAPALYAATIYMELKRIIVAIKAEHLSPVRIRWLTVLFVTGDVLSFVAQGLGGSLLARRDPKLFEMGENIIVAGLFIQLTFFALFFVTSVLVHIRVRKNPTALSELPNVPWRKHVFCLYFMSVLIFVRSLFRVVEYLQGYNGYLLGHEVFLYVFDATLMTFVTYSLNVVHPSEIDALTHGGVVSRKAGLKHEWVDAAESKRIDDSGRGTELSSLEGRELGRAV